MKKLLIFVLLLAIGVTPTIAGVSTDIPNPENCLNREWTIAFEPGINGVENFDIKVAEEHFKYLWGNPSDKYAFNLTDFSLRLVPYSYTTSGEAWGPFHIVIRNKNCANGGGAYGGIALGYGVGDDVSDLDTKFGSGVMMHEMAHVVLDTCGLPLGITDYRGSQYQQDLQESGIQKYMDMADGISAGDYTLIHNLLQFGALMRYNKTAEKIEVVPRWEDPEGYDLLRKQNYFRECLVETMPPSSPYNSFNIDPRSVMWAMYPQMRLYDAEKPPTWLPCYEQECSVYERNQYKTTWMTNNPKPADNETGVWMMYEDTSGFSWKFYPFMIGYSPKTFEKTTLTLLSSSSNARFTINSEIKNEVGVKANKLKPGSQCTVYVNSTVTVTPYIGTTPCKSYTYTEDNTPTSLTFTFSGKKYTVS